jgi:hypothetical protein
MVSRFLLLLSLVALVGAPARAAEDEAAGPADLKITVVDQTGAALITASVTIVEASGASRTVPVDSRGQASIPGLALGSVTVRVEAEAFETYEGLVTLKRGANNVTVNLPLAGINEEVLVQNDASNEDSAFSTTLTEQQIAELPDDPDELEQMLLQMAGPGATMRINGFRGGRLPPKNQIQSIRFRMNSYAADRHEAGGGFGIDITTKPGMNGWRGMTNFGFRDETLNARNAFAPTLGDEQYRRFGFNMDGPIVKGKTSMSINVEGNANYDSQTINATTPAGNVSDSIRRPTDDMAATVGVDHQLTATQLMRVEFRAESSERENLGVGDTDLYDRAYSRSGTEQRLRFTLNGLLFPKVAHELKMQYANETTELSSISDDPAIVVIDSFSDGGAGQYQDRRGRLLEIEDNIDFEIGKKHRMRVGMLLEGMWFQSDELRNGNGTWTFGGLEQYELGLATTYTRREGSTLVNYNMFQGAWYVQDDYTPSKKLSLSFGLRYELQSHLDDRWNFAPRVGFTWTPGKYTLRGGYGIFNDWYESSVYEQTLRVNGVTQQDIVVQNPVFPDPTGGALANPLPPSKYLSALYDMPYLHQASISVERNFFENLRLMTSYTMMRGRDQIRARNLNAPITGGLTPVRPDPTLGNVTAIESTGTTEIDRFMVNVNYAIPEKRFFMGGNYQLGRANNFTDNPFSLPANNFDLAAEWGPSMQDVRHRAFAMVNFGVPWAMRLGIFGQAQSATPYNIITGFDTNRDTVVNDRPEGVGRNAARGASSWNLNARLSKAFGFGPQRDTSGGPQVRRVGGGGGRGPGGGGGGPMMMMMDGGNNRYRMEFYVQAFNIVNRVNYQSFVGNMRSENFGLPLSAGPARRIEVGMNFGF